MSGPLSGLRVIEIGSIGPGPFAAMMLADHGADVIRIDRPGAPPSDKDALLRSRRSITLDLKNADDVSTLRALVRTADALIEGFRPGTMERLGIGPDTLMADNPRLIYGRMTGWGQTGPYAPYAGHDINYIAMAGALHAIGPAERPVPPLALAGDFGGGGMLLAFSITAALLNTAQTGRGQIIDCAMTEGAGLLMAAFYSGLVEGWWDNKRASNFTDGGAHFYGAYETLDGHFVAIGAIEPQFYAQLIERLGLSDEVELDAQMEKASWPGLRDKIAAVIKRKTRAEWCAIMEYSDLCFAPVLSLTEAPYHPHAVARQAFVKINDIVQPAPAPRFSVTPLDAPHALRRVDPADLGV
ncbi:MAG: Alpha-methylacyl-CoA racemase [Rhizorhabdus sp.]|nr:Alpha-methylacyl-CoA racemase [Rhizorhabdus sp.]